MVFNYFLDESGNTGDLVHAGETLTFGAQPYFSLVAVGIDDIDGLARAVSALKMAYGLKTSELRSTSLKHKPRFAPALIGLLLERNCPIFIEVVDKLFYICANLTSFLLVPPVGKQDFEPPLIAFRNTIAEFLRANMPPSSVHDYIAVCSEPCSARFERLLEGLLDWLDGVDSAPVTDAVRGLSKSALQQISGVRDGEDLSHLLPSPSFLSSGRTVWLLPHSTSLVHIYARLNRFHGDGLKDLVLVHDEQLQFEAVLREVKAQSEELGSAELAPELPAADFRFSQAGSLRFAKSEDALGIQIADIVAGFVTRHVTSALVGGNVNQEHAAIFDQLIRLGQTNSGAGINLVLTTPDIARLGVGVDFLF